MKKAAYDVEVQTKKAEAELAYELQAAKTKQRIKDEQMQIKVVERTQEILVQVWKNILSLSLPTFFQHFLYLQKNGYNLDDMALKSKNCKPN